MLSKFCVPRPKNCALGRGEGGYKLCTRSRSRSCLLLLLLLLLCRAQSIFCYS